MVCRDWGSRFLADAPPCGKCWFGENRVIEKILTANPPSSSRRARLEMRLKKRRILRQRRVAVRLFCPLEFMMSDIVSTAVAAGSFKTLAAALGAADLAATLQGPGPFTVFAPTDDAFAKLPAGAVDDLLLPENKGKLAAVLTYHVVSGKVTAAEVMKLTAAPTVQGSSVKVAVKDGAVHIDNATVVTADIECDNGVIHVIDTVLMPST